MRPRKHTLCTTYATKRQAVYSEKGLNVMEVAAITGHKNLKMLQRYTHLRAEDRLRSWANA